MEEPPEFGLLAFVGAVLIGILFGLGFALNYLLSRPVLVDRFPLAEPVRGAILSLMGVLLFALVLGFVISLINLFIG